MKKINNKNIISLILILVGIVGIIPTIILLLKTFSSSKDIGETVMTLVIYFLPFLLFFICISSGIKTLIKK
ncbi:MAG TPA: hypothetical protein VIK72_14085 [Clostridiaceae bacterium]